jgi:hypothetical protein
MKGSLTRSFGNEEGEELVVGLSDDGTVAFRRESVGRRLKRGEKHPELKLNVAEVMDNLSTPQVTAGEVEGILDQLIKKLPVAKFDGDTPAKMAYNLKVWMLQSLKDYTEK